MNVEAASIASPFGITPLKPDGTKTGSSKRA
jgi:hypothetical protein